MGQMRRRPRVRCQGDGTMDRPTHGRNMPGTDDPSRLGSDACGSQDMIIKAPVCVASNTRPAVERVWVGTSCFARKSIGGEEPKYP